MTARYHATHVYGAFVKKRPLCHEIAGLFATLASPDDAVALGAARRLAVVMCEAGADLPALGEWVVAVAAPTWQVPLWDMVRWCCTDINRSRTSQDDFAFLGEMVRALHTGRTTNAASEHRIHSIFLRLGGNIDQLPPSRH